VGARVRRPLYIHAKHREWPTGRAAAQRGGDTDHTRDQHTREAGQVGGGAPVEIAITPDGKTAYTVSLEGTVTPIATATNTPGKPIKVEPSVGQTSAIAIMP
jgi:DNA-binding beta-propeller fold protein YncE